MTDITVIALAPAPLTVVAVEAAPVVVVPAGFGLQGIPGPPGAPGTADSYEHTQSIPLAIWTVPHNLGRHPSVTVTNTLGEVITPDVNYIDATTVQITHGTALAGFVYCN